MLRTSWIPLSLLLLLCLAQPCAAQDARRDAGRDPAASAVTPESASNFTRTPEMWFYEQERVRYEDPKTAVRHRAELRGAQRGERIAALKWYGMSNSRPLVNCTPFVGGSYSAYWGSNTYDPNRWRPYYSPAVALRPTEQRY